MPGSRFTRGVPTGVATRVVGWADHHTPVGAPPEWATLWAGRLTRVESTTRGALTRALRRSHRKRPIRVGWTPTQVRTARPDGVRMGKGKGKPAGRYGWSPRGAVVAHSGGVPARPRAATLGGPTRVVPTRY